jgi:transcriptional repressor NrdR
MQCPFCGAGQHVRVTDTRPRDSGEVERRRLCATCGEYFTTVERISAHDTIVAKNGDRGSERFSRMKLRRGIQKAAANWSLNDGDLDAVVERVVKRLRPKPHEQVSSTRIAELVMRVLESDNSPMMITRIRFAMVSIGRTSRATRFQGLHEFMAWLEAQYGPPSAGRSSDTPFLVVKRNGQMQPFLVKKLERSVGIASKGRGSDAQVAALAERVAADTVRELEGQAIVMSQQIASEVLKSLKRYDELAYLRYASIVKRYQTVDDFWREAYALLDDLVVNNDANLRKKSG